MFSLSGVSALRDLIENSTCVLCFTDGEVSDNMKQVLQETMEDKRLHTIIIKTNNKKTNTDIVNAKYLILPHTSSRFYKLRLKHFYIRLELLLPDPSNRSYDNNEDQITATTPLSPGEVKLFNVNA